MSSPLADITHASSPSSNGQNSPMPSGSGHLHQQQQQHHHEQPHNLKEAAVLSKSSSLEMRPPSAVGVAAGSSNASAAAAEDVTSPLSCHSPLAVSSVISNPSASGGPNYFSLPLIKDEDLASVGSGASGQSRILGGASGLDGEAGKGAEDGGTSDLDDGDSKLVDSIEYESILEAEENYKELVEREWQQSK